MTPSDTMRAEFEAWATKNRIERFHWDRAWLAFQFAWQASAEAERGRVIEECALVADKFREKYGKPLQGEYSALYRIRAAFRIAQQIRALNRTAAQQET